MNNIYMFTLVFTFIIACNLFDFAHLLTKIKPLVDKNRFRDKRGTQEDKRISVYKKIRRKKNCYLRMASYINIPGVLSDYISEIY